MEENGEATEREAVYYEGLHLNASTLAQVFLIYIHPHLSLIVSGWVVITTNFFD